VCHFDFVYIFQGDERSLQKVPSFEKNVLDVYKYLVSCWTKLVAVVRFIGRVVKF